MSGTGFGTVVLRVAPESAVGGPLSRLRGRRHGVVGRVWRFFGCRRRPVRPRACCLPLVGDRRGWPVLHRMHVLQAPEGCDYDFLRPRSAEELAFVEPVIGRS